jgi:hypothetical protein
MYRFIKPFADNQLVSVAKFIVPDKGGMKSDFLYQSQLYPPVRDYEFGF